MIHLSGRDLLVPVISVIMVGAMGCQREIDAPISDMNGADFYKSEDNGSKSVCGDGKVEVCHKGNTLCISVNALPAHEAHGDPTCGCGDVTPLFVDQDGDDYGDSEASISACRATPGYAEARGDCDDADEERYPGALELCDAIDQDCDGLADVQDAATDEWLRSVCAAVLAPTAGSYDSRGVDQPAVIFNEDLGIYQMWYRAVDDGGTGRIAYATSDDGATWTKEAGPVLEPGPAGGWEDVKVGFPAVIYQDGLYRMWYQGQDALNAIRIGYAESTDGASWTKFDGNPVLDLGAAGSWDSRVVHAPSVIYDDEDGVFHLWYSGGDGTTLQTGYASSPDGLSWTKFAGNPVLKPGTVGDWDSKRVVFARVVRLGGRYHMWYSGDDPTNSYTYEIGYATASDPTAWTREQADPVFSFGVAGTFDDYMVYGGDVTEADDGFSMYYSGGSSGSGPYYIGLARSAGSRAMLADFE